MEDETFSADDLSDSEFETDKADSDSDHNLHDQSWLYSSDVAVRPLFDGSETTVLQALATGSHSILG